MPDAWFVNLGIEIENLPQIAFNIPLFGNDIPIYWYAVIVCSGIVAGLSYAVLEAKRTGQDPDTYIDFFFVAFIMAIVGARLYYVVFNFGLYKDNLLSVFNTRQGGLAVYGGLIGGILAAVLFSRRKGISLGLILDTCAPAFVLGQAVGRWCNFPNREAFGGFSDGLFALRYKALQVGFIPEAVFDQIINVNGVDYIQVAPTFLYESFFNFIVFIILNILKRHKVFDGQILLYYFMGYGVVRFFIEAMRTDQLMLFNTGLAVSRVLSALLVAVAVGVMAYKLRRVKRV
jgi:phosphatidylglycerol:prolipoprotein diacylglycerol transferase